MPERRLSYLTGLQCECCGRHVRMMTPAPTRSEEAQAFREGAKAIGWTCETVGRWGRVDILCPECSAACKKGKTE